MKPTRHQVDVVDVPLLGGRVLHVEVQRPPAGDPASLLLSIGAGEPGEWHHPHERITLPGAAGGAGGAGERSGRRCLSNPPHRPSVLFPSPVARRWPSSRGGTAATFPKPGPMRHSALAQEAGTPNFSTVAGAQSAAGRPGA